MEGSINLFVFVWDPNLGQVSDVVPVRTGEFQSPQEDLIEQILLHVALTTQEERHTDRHKSANRYCTVCAALCTAMNSSTFNLALIYVAITTTVKCFRLNMYQIPRTLTDNLITVWQFVFHTCHLVLNRQTPLLHYCVSFSKVLINSSK